MYRCIHSSRDRLFFIHRIRLFLEQCTMWLDWLDWQYEGHMQLTIFMFYNYKKTTRLETCSPFLLCMTWPRNVQMSDVATFLLVSLSVAGLCLATLLLSFPLHRQVIFTECTQWTQLFSLLVSLSVAGLCLVTLLLSFPLHHQVICIVGHNGS